MDYTKIVKVLSLAATGNSIDAALDEMSKKNLNICLNCARKKKPVAKLQRMGALAMNTKESENIEKLVSILLTFTHEQMAAFVAGAQEIITQYK